MIKQSKSEHILELASELLNDIELTRSSADGLLLKASRLARLVGSEEIKTWIKYEMGGYNLTDKISLKYMDLTGRSTDKEKKRGYLFPLSQLEACISAEKIKLKNMHFPDVSGNGVHIAIVIKQIRDEMNKTTKYISILNGVRSKVMTTLHKFVTDIYYEKHFDSLSESIFESYKREIDNLINETCGEVLEQIPSVMDRLANSDPESISQALNTCRRIIDSFADSIFPPSDETIEMNGNTVTLDAEKHQNRINAFVFKQITSNSRKKKIRQNLSNLYDRISTGVHKEVTAEEAKALFLNTYLLLGEILHIGKSEI